MTTPLEADKHGDERNHRVESREIAPGVTWEGTVMEKFCEDCGWQTVEGILIDVLGCPVCEREWS